MLVLRLMVVPFGEEEMGVSAGESRPYEALQRMGMEHLGLVLMVGRQRCR